MKIRCRPGGRCNRRKPRGDNHRQRRQLACQCLYTGSTYREEQFGNADAPNTIYYTDESGLNGAGNLAVKQGDGTWRVAALRIFDGWDWAPLTVSLYIYYTTH